MYRPSGRARRLFCRVIFPGKRPGGSGAPGWLPWFAGAGRFAARRRRGGVRGGMRASRPTDVLWVLHQPGTPPAPAIGNPCRGGFHIRPGCWRRRKAGRYGIGPYGGAGGVAAKGGVYGGAGVAGRCKHRPLHGFAMPQDCGFPVGCGPRPVCREGSRPFRRALRRGNRADRESAPTAVREGLRPCGGVRGVAGSAAG